MAIKRATEDTIATPAGRRKRIPCDVALDVRDKALDIIQRSIDQDPRSLQTEIGPSEVGDPCDYCLAAKLAGLKQKLDGGGMHTWAGKAIHDYLDVVFEPEVEWSTSKRLYVGEIDGRRIEGTTDVAHTADPFTVVDWKYVGNRTLEKVMFEGVPQVYECQKDIYGLGYELEGNPPKFTALYFLPREKNKLRLGYWWATPYDPERARWAMRRAEIIAEQVRLFGFARVAPTLAKLDDCYDCERWIIPEEK